MTSKLEQNVCNRVEALQEELASLLGQLVSINTADPPAENYVQCAQLLAGYLKQLGAHVDILEPTPEYLIDKSARRPNVVGEIAGTGKKPGLHFNGHYDVVTAPGEWSTNPFKAEIKNGKLYGRGSVDMKSGIVAAMGAARALNQEGVKLAGNLSFSFVPDEENDGLGGAKFLTERKKIKADYCIVCEPSGTVNFFNGHKGCLWLEIITHGKSAHGSTPWKGINAFEAMIKIVEEINARIKPSLLHQEGSELDRTTTNKFGTITMGGKVTTGESINVVPPKCTMTIDRRLAPGEKLADVHRDFASILKTLQEKNPNFKAELNVLSQYEACATPVDSTLSKVLKDSIQSVSGKTPEIWLMTAGCDLRYFYAAGIPGVIYGPGNLLMAHQIDESIEVKDLVTVAQAYALTAMRLLGT